MCRRERDAQLYSAIEHWETSKYTKMSKNDKGKYLNVLQEDRDKLETTLKELPMSIANKHRRWRF
jgi:hypothetical protein